MATVTTQTETYRVAWIALMHYEQEIDVRVRNGRVLVDQQTAREMARGIREAEIAPPEDDEAYAQYIEALPVDDNGDVDVTDIGGDMIQDQLLDEYGIKADRGA